MKNIVVLLVAAALISCNSQSQTKPVSSTVAEKENLGITKASFHKYGAGDIVYQGYLDKAGNMWFATSQEGVYRFDGQSFTHYDMEDGLCGNDITSIIEDRDGFFWFG